MELRHVRYFLVLADELNFTRAAARLGIGQPPLSQQIRDLEREVGVQLFRRVPRGAQLTDAGRVFLDGVRTLPDQVASAVHLAQRAARGEIGSVRVGFTGSAVFNDIVPSTIRLFRRALPDVELTLQEANSNHLAGALRDGGLDVAFLRPDAVSLDGLSVHLVDSESMIAAVPAGFSARHGVSGAIGLGELSGEPFILTPRHLGPTLVDVVLRSCREAGFDPVLGQTAPQIPAVLALVAADLGVTVVPSSMRQAAIGGVEYIALSDVRSVANLAVAHRQDDTGTATRRFVDQARRLSSEPRRGSGRAAGAAGASLDRQEVPSPADDLAKPDR